MTTFSLKRRQNHEKNCSEGEKWSRKTLDGKCDGSMWGLGGAQKQEILKKYWFYYYFSKGQGGHEDARESLQLSQGGGGRE